MSSTSTMTMSSSALDASLPLLPLTGHDANDSSSTTVALKSLYSRAARAFLQRDINLTLTLITSALPLIHSPPSADDPLAAWRRKWDILRITLETTVYATPPADPESLPAYLRANLMLSPQSLLAALHTRSLLLFTPAIPGSETQEILSAGYLPVPVLITLVLASMKLGVADVGRGMIEDWLARRDGDKDVGSEEGEGYDKVIELYCLHILPKLEEWDYATEFLQYEGQLDSVRRHRLMYSLETLHSETMAVRQPRPRTPSTPSLSPSSTSPRPSSSSGSSVSSSSELTATPRTPRYEAAEGKRGTRDDLAMTSSNLPQSTTNSTTTSRTATPKLTTVSQVRPKYKHKTRHSSSRAPVLDPPTPSGSVHPPSTMTVIKSTLALAKSYFSSHQFNFATLLVVAFTLISLIQLRRARRTPRITGSGSSTPNLRPKSLPAKGDAKASTLSAAEQVRKKLSTGGDSKATNPVAMIWNEAVRVVGDTVRMGGRGLV